jgi:beta-glucanase (GH16 family)
LGTYTNVNPTPLPSDGWKLTFFDGFDNDYVLDRAAWPILFHGGTYWNGAFSWNQNNVFVMEGELSLYSIASSNGWTSGAVNMGWNGQVYGRWEVRARLDEGKGTSAAILLWPTDGDYPPEIDLMESPDPNRTLTSMTVHSEGFQEGHQVVSDASEWHTYAVDWLEDRITFYIDGVEQWTTTNRVPSEPMALGFMGFVASSSDEWFGGAPDWSTPGYVGLHIDWVRIWTPEELHPGELAPTLYWNQATGWAAPPETVTTRVRSIGEERFAASWNGAEWGATKSVSVAAGTNWAPGTSDHLFYANYESAHLDLRAAPSALTVQVIGTASGSFIGGTGADDITWLVHADAAVSAKSAVIMLDGGDDRLLITTPSASWLAQPFGYGGRWNGSYDGSLSKVSAYGATGNDRIEAQGMVTLVADGGTGNDTIIGGGGADRLRGGIGADDLTGGGGADIFILMHGAIEGGDTIRDFTPGVDKLGLYGLNPTLVTTTAGQAGLTVAYGGEVLAVLQGVTTLQNGDILFA